MRILNGADAKVYNAVRNWDDVSEWVVTAQYSPRKQLREDK